jgi:hypothetical protein
MAKKKKTTRKKKTTKKKKTSKKKKSSKKIVKKVKKAPVVETVQAVEASGPDSGDALKEIKLKPKKKKKKKKPSPLKLPDKPVEKEVITVGGSDEDDDSENDGPSKSDLALLEKKWWLQEPWRSLLDPELSKNFDFKKYDLSVLIEEFTEKMLKEELIDFRISGLAIYSSAKMYHWKISSVIKEEEEIEKEKVKERIKREVPKAISQPLREARKLASSDELFGAMRRAIIETMQKREKLRIRRVRTLAKRETVVRKKGKGKLPAEILKHITGSEETIEQRLKKWHQKLKEIIRLEGNQDDTISFNYIKKMLYNQGETLFEKKVKYIHSFEAFLFLASLNKVIMRQDTMKSPIEIHLTDKTGIDL